MSQTFAHAVDLLIESHLDFTFPAAQIAIYQSGKLVHARAFGWQDPETRAQPITPDTRFDLASVSKLFVVAAFMTLVEEGKIELDTPVRQVLPAFDGRRAIAPYPHPLKPGEVVQVVPPTAQTANAGATTFRQLLTHTSGLPAWLPLWKMDTDIAGRREAALTCDFAYPPGTHVVYSDIGLILVGFALEALTGQTLREVVRQRVAAPLGLASIGYGPISPQMAAPTELYAHQPARMHGEVHDENAWALGGASGHAGLFGNAVDVAAFGEALRAAKLLRPETLREMTRIQAQDGAVRRGIGFALWSPAPESPSYPLSPLTFGHTGFTGTSLWMDPLRELTVACLTNHVYYGRGQMERLPVFRTGLHRLVAELFAI
jgi:CubicO group peptidase (beta-lactamase class C family)